MNSQIKIGKKMIAENEKNILEELMSKIGSGKSILFTGAGFSTNTTNLNDEEPPRSNVLAKIICNLGAFQEDEDLRFASEYYLIKNIDKTPLIKLLKKTYTLKSINESHKSICSFKWQRFYTTNYDNSIELACAENGIQVNKIDINQDPQLSYKLGNLCIHLNGSIDDLSEETLNSRFKLTTSSYVSADSFVSSNWFYYFKRDIERCNALVFIGYSLYDIEIQKVLFNNEAIKEKTYFIVEKNPNPKIEFTLSNYGTVLPIGLDYFASNASHYKKIYENVSSHSLESLIECELSNNYTEIRDIHSEKLLMYGDFDQSQIDSAVVSEQRIPFVIIRDYIKKTLEFLRKRKCVFIFSDFGNGKTVFLSLLAPYLLVNNFKVYKVEDIEGDYITDLDVLACQNTTSVILIDDYEKYIDLINHYGKSNPSNILLVATSRTTEHEKLRILIKSLDIDFNELNIDELTKDEIEEFIKIIDNLGYWGETAGNSNELKQSHIINSNNRQISLALLDIFDSPQIKDRVSGIIKNIINNNSYRDTIFAISLLEILNLQSNFSLISEIAFNDEIYGPNLRLNNHFLEMFKVGSTKVISKSSLFCTSLIKNHFSPSYTIKQLHKISHKYSNNRMKPFHEDKIFKATLRFSFVERLLPDNNKKSSLKRYYEDLKVAVPWLIKDPHFWLQYGMANIPYKEYGKAQTFFDQAYSLANKKDNFHTNDIDTQQARLFILVAIETCDFKKFQEAHVLLSKTKNDAYKFRQVKLYKDFFESCFSRLSKGNSALFEQYCKTMISDIKKAEENGDINMNEYKSTSKTKDSLEQILKNI